jgi:FlaA1/EpsC-like NDP-sugar epimerase
MLIFIRKHFEKREYGPYLLFIRIAIYFLGTIAVLKNLFARYILPLADAIVICLVFASIIPSWGKFRFGSDYNYPDIFSYLFIPAYIVVILLSVFITGGYRLPSKPSKVFRGLLAGSVMVLVIYALLPPDYRFSRAVIVLGSLTIIIIIPVLRILLAAAGVKFIINPYARAGKTAIVSDEEGYHKISRLISESGKKQVVAGRVGLRPDDLGKDVLGSIDQIRDIIKVNHINEVVFSTKELSASQIIESMQLVAECNIDIRISPPGETILIGSKSISSN